MTLRGTSRLNGCLLVVGCLLAVGGCRNEPAVTDTAGAVDAASEGAEAPAEQKRLGNIRLDPAIFGSDWETCAGFVVDSWDDLSHLPAAARLVASGLRSQMEPLGVIALADYSCIRKVFPLNTVTVRVFRFKSAQLASAWGEKKCQYSGWEQHYTSTDGVSYFAVDSTQLKKRCVILGEYWITSHHIGEDDLHIKALGAIAEQLGLAL